MIRLIHGEAIEEMTKLIQEGVKVDAIITDPPQGKTACKWDVIIPFEPMWKCIKGLRKDRTPVVLFGNEPYSSMLRMSNLKEYKYDWVWEKSKGSQFLNAKRRPLESHEVITVFYKKLSLYIPQMVKGKPYIKKAVTNGDGGCYGAFNRIGEINKNEGTRFPRTVIKFSNPNNHSLHKTQKPVPLMEYLIKTYTKEGDIVLDFTSGSCSTGEACINLNRRFIGIEKDKDIFNIGRKRIETVQRKTT